MSILALVPENLLTIETLLGLYSLMYARSPLSEAAPDVQVLYDLSVLGNCWVDRPEHKDTQYYLTTYVFDWFSCLTLIENRDPEVNTTAVWNSLCLLEPILPKCSRF